MRPKEKTRSARAEGTVSASTGLSTEGPEANLRTYLGEFGLLSCNGNRYLPSLDDVGGDWTSIVHLMEQREVFYSKVFMNRTTYLSSELYFLMKPHRQRLEPLPGESKRIYDVLRRSGPTDTGTLKKILDLPANIYAASFGLLLQELLVTVTGRDRDLTPTWSSFRWGTFQEWEKKATPPQPAANDRLWDLLRGNLDDIRIGRWLNLDRR